LYYLPMVSYTITINFMDSSTESLIISSNDKCDHYNKIINHITTTRGIQAMDLIDEEGNKILENVFITKDTTLHCFIKELCCDYCDTKIEKAYEKCCVECYLSNYSESILDVENNGGSILFNCGITDYKSGDTLLYDVHLGCDGEAESIFKIIRPYNRNDILGDQWQELDGTIYFNGEWGQLIHSGDLPDGIMDDDDWSKVGWTNVRYGYYPQL